MTDISNMHIELMSDHAIVEKIGAFIRHHRLQQNKTQEQLSAEAGINRSTLIEVEKGMRYNIITLIQLLRILKQLNVLSAFEINEQPSPIQLAELQMAKRQRASKPRKPVRKPLSRRK